jgi:hypothetical protein
MRIPLKQLLGFTNRVAFSAAVSNRAWDIRQIPFTDTIGFHIYSDLAVELRRSAGDEKAAAKYLHILQVYAKAAESVCESDWLRILEVQGGRLHLYAESSPAQVQRLIQSCRKFYRLATGGVSAIAGNTQFTIRMAADHGRAILLRSTGEDISESIVSLGNPANRPAKLLSQDVSRNGVKAGHLALNRNALTDGDAEWTQINLAAEGIRKSHYEGVTGNALIENSTQGSMTAFAAAEIEENPGNPVFAPITRRGFMLRADLDGFSARVNEAMAQGGDAILALVREFNEIMKYPLAFASTLPKGVSVTIFPWAGDCANIFLECDNYPLEQCHLPHKAARNWHSVKPNGTNWSALFGKTQWLVAIAGGSEENGHGSILTGNVIAEGRTFHVGAGWIWHRSLEAEQAESNRATESVIQCEDYDALDAHLKDAFRDHSAHPKLFKTAALADLNKTALIQKRAAAISVAATVPSLHIPAPAPRPYGGY